MRTSFKCVVNNVVWKSAFGAPFNKQKKSKMWRFRSWSGGLMSESSVLRCEMEGVSSVLLLYIKLFKSYDI